jgi:hypothetical protein
LYILVFQVRAGGLQKTNAIKKPFPAGRGESSKPGEEALGLIDFLVSSFVFIYILALFPRFWKA